MPHHRKPQKHIAIIGGGISGLTLAFLLSRDGYAVTLFEKEKKLGGILATSSFHGIRLEHFYHHFFRQDHDLLRLLHELKLESKILWHESPAAFYHEGSFHPFVTKMDFFRLPFLSLPGKIRGALGNLRLVTLNNMTIAPDLSAKKLICQTSGPEIWKTIWRPLFTNKFGSPFEEKISAQWFVSRLQTRVRSDRGGKEVLGYIDGSFQVLIDRLKQEILKNGGKIVTNTPVRSIRSEKQGITVNETTFDCAVSTIAPPALREVAGDCVPKTNEYLGAITALFLLEKNLCPYYWTNILDTNVPFTVMVNQRILVPGEYRDSHPLYLGRYLSSASDHFNLDLDALADYYTRHLLQIFPQLQGSIKSCKIFKEKYAQPVATVDRKMPPTKIGGHLYLTSMEHIFPEDRGLNQAVREAYRLSDTLNSH